MKLTKKNLINLLILLSIAVSSCSKEGDVGPMGPQGEQGIQGPEGPQGPAGPAGEDADTQESSDSDNSAGGEVEAEDGEDGEQGEQGETGPQGEPGETGPQGEPGETGPQGEPGETGPQGEPGEDGNANVIDSGWIPIDFTSGIMRIESPEFTFETVSNSLIIVFGLWIDGEDIVYQLPHEIGSEKFSFDLINDASGRPFSLRIIARNIDGTVDEDDNITFCTAVKYFIIPSNTLSGKGSFDNFEKMTYQELVDYFDLK